MTRRLGLIARGDCGGLGAQTWEAYRHLQPDVTLLLDFGSLSRGGMVPDTYGEDVMVSRGVPRNRMLYAFLEQVDVVFTCETTYSVRLGVVARELGVDVVVQANPEMFQPLQYPDARIVLPTLWEHHRIPHGELLPVPVNRQVLPFRRRDRVEVLYHLAAPAMNDRNGTDLVLAALDHVEHRCKLIVRGAPEGPSRRGNVSIEWLPHETRPYHELYPDEADALLLPRRYGGLCLPAQESASLGWPLVTLALPPLQVLDHAVTIPVTGAEPVHMQGGTFHVHTADPVPLAHAIDELLERPTGELSDAAGRWAESLSWPALLPRYREVLGCR